MKVAIECKDRTEANYIKTAMNDPTLRATVLIVGALMPLSHRARQRVLAHVTDRLEEQNEAAAYESGDVAFDAFAATDEERAAHAAKRK